MYATRAGCVWWIPNGKRVCRVGGGSFLRMHPERGGPLQVWRIVPRFSRWLTGVQVFGRWKRKSWKLHFEVERGGGRGGVLQYPALKAHLCWQQQQFFDYPDHGEAKNLRQRLPNCGHCRVLNATCATFSASPCQEMKEDKYTSSGATTTSAALDCAWTNNHDSTPACYISITSL